jgi:hypothetical protein
MRSISRSFRYDPDGISSHVRVYGDRRSTWRRNAVSGLVKAGYAEAFAFKDETWCRRWLSGTAPVVTELSLLRALGVDVSPRRWPHRAASKRPARPRPLSQAELVRMLEVVRSAGINWNDFVLGYSRSGPLRMEGIETPLTVRVVTALGDAASQSGFYGVTAFKDPTSNAFAILAINSSGATMSGVTLGISGANIVGAVTPYVTSGTPLGALGTDGNLSAGSASANIPASLAVSKGVFTSSIPYGVTTFVGMAQ